MPDVLALRDGKLTRDDTRLGGVLLQLRDGVTGLPIFGSAALPGMYAADQPITTVTDANGHYEFVGLPPGVYGVYDVKLDGTYTGIDTAGSLGGVCDQRVGRHRSGGARAVAVAAGARRDSGHHIAGRRKLDRQQLQRGGDDRVYVRVIAAAARGSRSRSSAAGSSIRCPRLFPPPQYVFPYLLQPVITRAGGALYTWHLSVVDAGQPRGPCGRRSSRAVDRDAPAGRDPVGGRRPGRRRVDVCRPARRPGQRSQDAVRHPRRNSRSPATSTATASREVGVFKDGHWFIDLNGNGVWDEGDLWAKLGHKGDQPVTGDWDGDGKTDIGIYGPAWPGDPRAVAHEPGLPDPHNANTRVQKNIPRPAERTAVGERTLKLTANGKPRADLIDHVFFYGTPGDHPIVGDWNGDGTHTIAVFRDGVWHRDTDGDGKWSEGDAKANFGRPGDCRSSATSTATASTSWASTATASGTSTPTATA